jgi:Uncharacterized protein conserved in bacteria
MKKTKKITILLRTAYIVLGFFITLFAIDKIIMPYYVSGDEVKVPNVVGLDQNRAGELFDSVGLDYTIKGMLEVDDPSKDGKILQQKPSNGKIVKAGRVILLWVGTYKGEANFSDKPLVEVPDLIGRIYSEAEQILMASNLKIVLINKVAEPDPEAPILEQSRPPGTKVPEGSFIWVRLDMPGGEIVDTVKYSIEKNDDEEKQTTETETITMPGLIGMVKAVAIQKLNDLGLVPGNITEKVSPNHMPGTVISQV